MQDKQVGQKGTDVIPRSQSFAVWLQFQDIQKRKNNKMANDGDYGENESRDGES